MKLCFGTYAGVLLLCGTERATKIALLNTLVQSADKTCKLTNNAVTGLLQCVSNLPDGRGNGLGNVVSGAREVDPQKIAEYFSKKVIPLLDPNKQKLAIRAIREIIIADDTISGDTAVGGITKKALQKQSSIVLADFLAGVFLYTAAVDNRIGKEATAFITDEFIQSFTDSQNDAPLSDDAPESPDEIIQEYLSNVKEKFTPVKTFLYRDHPRPFYDFYVPNNIAIQINRGGKAG